MTSFLIGAGQAVDWRKHVRASNKVRYQGSCGSCWAIAAGSALEMHAELAGYSVPGLQVNQLVGCVPNTRHCGGGGGCDGATAELAFQYAAEHGVAFEDDLKWDTKGGLCQKAPKRIISQGFERLTPNLALPLQYALAMKGPVVVSADASDWELYGGGVFDDCPKNAAVNHAVLAVGYGVSTSGKYWLIRNSWGKEWGEAGHIRILRFEDGSDGYCGTDYHPQEGVACDGEWHREVQCPREAWDMLEAAGFQVLHGAVRIDCVQFYDWSWRQREAADLFQGLAETRMQALAKLEVSLILSKGASPKSAFQAASEALELLDRLGDKQGMGRALYAIAVSLVVAKDYSAAMTKGLEALELVRAAGDKRPSGPSGFGGIQAWLPGRRPCSAGCLGSGAGAQGLGRGLGHQAAHVHRERCHRGG
ncbi:unnamed protein product [Effrenium voratum]|nr:unnamed protein product [Effrenium voratum]